MSAQQVIYPAYNESGYTLSIGRGVDRVRVARVENTTGMTRAEVRAACAEAARILSEDRQLPIVDMTYLDINPLGANR